MKKLMTIALTATALTLTTAHDTRAQEISFGLKGGLNKSEVTLPLASVVRRSRATGFHAGAILAIQVSPLVDVQIEALYTEKGLAGARPDRDLRYELEGGYVEIPLLAKVRAPWAQDAAVVPYAFAGPSLAFEVNCQIRGHEGPTILNYLCDGPPVHFDERKKFDYGLMLGVGAEVGTGMGRLLLDIAYDWGVRDLADSPDIPGAVRHGAFMISVGFATKRGR